MEKEEVKSAFRNINSISIIPDNIYEKLYNNGKIEEWEKIFSNNTISNAKKAEIRNEIQKYTINVTFMYYLEYDKKELFYNNSNIYRTPYKYEFDEKELKGRGLIMQIEGGNNQF